MIFLHNHPAEDGRAAMFPSYDDFGAAPFLVYRGDPRLTVEFRILQTGKEDTIVSYGFKRSALLEIRNLALEYRSTVARKADVGSIELKQNLIDYHLAQDSFNHYLRHTCPVDPARKDAEVCRTHPQYFTWPSDRFFIHYRPK